MGHNFFFAFTVVVGARHALAGGARRRGHRRDDLHPHGGRRAARAGDHGGSRVAQARDYRRDRPAHRPHRPRVGRHRRGRAGDARDARAARSPPVAARARHAGADGGADGAAGSRARCSSACWRDGRGARAGPGHGSQGIVAAAAVARADVLQARRRGRAARRGWSTSSSSSSSWRCSIRSARSSASPARIGLSEGRPAPARASGAAGRRDRHGGRRRVSARRRSRPTSRARPASRRAAGRDWRASSRRRCFSLRCSSIRWCG